MNAPSWETYLSGLIERGDLRVEKDQTFEHGAKYSITPHIHFEDLRGNGSPIGDTWWKGWITPSSRATQDLLKNLKRYVCRKLNIEYIDSKHTSLTLFNHASYTHNVATCYPTCERVFDQPEMKTPCLRTWVFNDIHKTDGRLNKNVCQQPWYNVRTCKISALSRVSGRITSFYLNNDSGHLKFWCNVDYGEVEARFTNDKFTDEEFERLLEKNEGV
jgi:hypothetical protein